MHPHTVRLLGLYDHNIRCSERLARNIASDTILSTVGVKSTTPLGSPPKDFIPLANGSEQPVNSGGHANGAPPADTSAILKALADMAKTNTGTPVQANASNVTNFQNPFPQNVPAPVNQAPSLPPASRAVGVVPGVNGGATSFMGSSSASGNFPPSLPHQPPNMQLPAPMPIQGNGAPAMTPEVQQQLEILKALQAQGVPQDQWATVLSVVMAQAGGAMSNQQAAPPQHGWQQAGGGYGDQSRDRNGFDKPSLRSPSGRFRNARSRSRSPVAWDRRNASPPHRRDSPVYGEYARDAHNNDRGGFGRSDRGRGGNQFRQRSPGRNRRSPSPRRASHERGLPPPGPKMVEYDPNLRQGTIKGTYSRANIHN